MDCFKFDARHFACYQFRIYFFIHFWSYVGQKGPFYIKKKKEKKGQVRKVTNLFLEIVFSRLKSLLSRYNDSLGMCGE